MNKSVMSANYEEIWKPAVGYEGIYEVSNLGNVRNRKKLLKPGNILGYRSVGLNINGKCRGWRVHRLVATAFIPNPENKPCVNHLDSNRSNNRLDNLEWCTHKENNAHMMSKGRHHPRSGTTHPVAKITEEQVIQLRKDRAEGYTLLDLQIKYKIHPNTISGIINGLWWKDSFTGERPRRTRILKRKLKEVSDVS